MNVFAGSALDAYAIRRQFPILNAELPRGGLPVFLDSAASAQKHQSVIDKENEVQSQYFANAYRGRYYFGSRIDEELESSREKVRELLNAESREQIAFTAGTTLAINQIAFGWGIRNVAAGDEIVTTIMEHHANFVPWQQLAKQTGATLRVIPITDDGLLDPSSFDEFITKKTRIVAVSGMSNMLGTVNPIEELTQRAHAVGARILVDAAQSVPHGLVDVTAPPVDFLVFSGHKLYGPTGVGVLYGRRDALEEMDPWIFGGHMIERVTVEESTWAEPPARFEAGTLPIVQAIALGSAVTWVREVGLSAIADHEAALTQYAWDRLSEIPGMRIYGPEPGHRGGIISFRIDRLHPEDLAAMLDRRNVFTRHGHHCTMPLHDFLGVSATTRMSFGAYSTTEDVDALVDAIEFARKKLRIA